MELLRKGDRVHVSATVRHDTKPEDLTAYVDIHGYYSAAIVDLSAVTLAEPVFEIGEVVINGDIQCKFVARQGDKVWISAGGIDKIVPITAVRRFCTPPVFDFVFNEAAE